MKEDLPASPADDRWRQMLTLPSPHLRRRRLHRHIPSAPRCKLCAVPFEGPGGLVFRFFGHRRWPKNPKYCEGCFRMLRGNHGGAEIECSLLFADVRGSTTLAEGMSPRDFNRLMGRFYDVAVETLVGHDAFVDKFVGDEIIGIFVPAMAGELHSARAIEAAMELMRSTGHSQSSDPWVPIGAGVHTGMAYVGSIGQGSDTELTAMGDVVNTTARLASAARAGEVVVTNAAAQHARMPTEGREHRSLPLRGKSERTDVIVLSVSP